LELKEALEVLDPKEDEDHWEPEEHLVHQDLMDHSEQVVPVETQERLDPEDLKVQKDRAETVDFQDVQAVPVPQANKVKMVDQVLLDLQETMEIQDQMVPPDHQDQQEPPDKKVHVVSEDLLVRAGKRGALVFQDHPEKQEPRETVDQQEFQENLEELENKDQLETQEKMADQERQVPQD